MVPGVTVPDASAWYVSSRYIGVAAGVAGRAHHGRSSFANREGQH
jgi:hypothetical protein